MKRNLILLSFTLLMANPAALAVDSKTAATVKSTATTSSTKTTTTTTTSGKAVTAPRAAVKKGLNIPPPPSVTVPGNVPWTPQTVTPASAIAPASADAGLVTVGEGGPYSAKDEKVQRFADYAELKKGMESAELTFTLHNNGFKWFRVLIANQVVATEKSQGKDGSVKVDVTGIIQPGSNQVVIQAGGARGASIDWKVTTVATAKLERVDPDDVLVGETVAIKGQNFALNPKGNEVKFGSKAGKVLQAKATELKVVVPTDAAPGDNEVIAKVNGVKTNTIKVKVRGVPSVSGTNLQGVPPGQVVTVFGKNFSKNLGENRVFFDNTTAEIVSGDTSQLVVVVPAIPFREGHYPSQVRVQVGKVMSKTSAQVQVGPQMFTEPGTEVGRDIPEFVAR